MEAAEEGEEKGGDEMAGNSVASWKEKIEKEWQKIRYHAETYPYVWASYGLVYGSFGIYLAYRWRKLRRTEDRVRVLQMRLRKLAEEEDAAAASCSGSDAAKNFLSGALKSDPTPKKLD